MTSPRFRRPRPHGLRADPGQPEADYQTEVTEAKPPAIMYEGLCPRPEFHPDYMIALRQELSLP
ncbi:hypothetical protein [Micromonospora sp. CPCC 206061]|uniref:hypothetical protein n=1 Tax=Micromonospora sp. CPCC 206061 TaxID=3122410 RepID=UPI002FF08F2E